MFKIFVTIKIIMEINVYICIFLQYWFLAI